MGALNIGAKPTFEDYTSTLRFFFWIMRAICAGKNKRFVCGEIRDIVKFDGPESLKRQIAADVEKTKIILKNK